MSVAKYLIFWEAQFFKSEYILHAFGGDYYLVSGIKTSQGQSRAVVNIKIWIMFVKKIEQANLTQNHRHGAIFIAGMFYQSGIWLAFYAQRLSVIPSINMWSEDAAGKRAGSCFSYWCCSFFLLTYLPSFKYLFSFLFKLGSTQGNEFLYEVKYEISGTELLMHFNLASTIAFPRTRVCIKFFLTLDVANVDHIFYVLYLYRTFITASVYVIQIFSRSCLIQPKEKTVLNVAKLFLSWRCLIES